jgi:hypothetical protein
MKRVDPDSKIANVVEILSQQNDILDDMLFIEGNLPTGHRTTLRTSLPTGTFRSINSGVLPTKSTSAQIEDAAAMLETYSEIDQALCELNGNDEEFRLSEDKAFLEGLNQQMAGTLFYGNQRISPQTFTGLAPRYNTVQTAVTPTATNVLDAGGLGSTNTSIWLAVWGDNSLAGFFPKGAKTGAGLTMEDKGLQTIYDGVGGGVGGRYEAYRTHFLWKMGLTVRDWRFCVRIANIDVTGLPVTGTLGSNNQPNLSGKADLITLMQRAMRKIPNMGMGRPAFYVNRAVASAIDIQAANRPNLLRSVEDVMGKRYDTFQGIPIRICDQLLGSEGRVT